MTNQQITTALLVLVIIVGAFLCGQRSLSTQTKEVTTDWHTYQDWVNAWEIQYPPEVTNVILTSGDMESVTSVLFNENSDSYAPLIDINVYKNEWKNVESIVEKFTKEGTFNYVFEKYITVDGVKAAVFSQKFDTFNRRYLYLIKRGKLFVITTLEEINHDNVWASFKTTY